MQLYLSISGFWYKIFSRNVLVNFEMFDFDTFISTSSGGWGYGPKFEQIRSGLEAKFGDKISIGKTEAGYSFYLSYF